MLPATPAIDYPLENCQYEIIDSLKNVLYQYGEVFTLNNDVIEIETSFNMNIRGDVNCDRVVNNMDALLVLKYAADTKKASYLQKYYADYNADSAIDATDALLCLQMTVGKSRVPSLAVYTQALYVHTLMNPIFIQVLSMHLMY